MDDASGGATDGAPGGREVRVKICGLMRNVDARAAEAAGAELLGIVCSPGFGRSVPGERAGEVMAGTTIPRVAVLVDESPEGAEAAARAVDASVLQLHGEEDRATVREIRRRGEWTLWKAVRARRLSDLRRAVDRLADEVDGFLVEGWRRGVTGGGGVRLALDPEEVRAAVPRELDFILAGGLEPTTVAEEVARFRPDVVDVSSGVERDVGSKDAKLISAFVEAARGGPA